MTLNKQLSSSTGSSSGSSSDSSSTSASSSSSYSESSSSDTDSSSSEQTAQPAPTATSPPRRPTPRRSTDTRPSQPTPTPATPAAAKPPTEKPSTSRLKTPVKSPVKKSSVSSSEEDVVVKTEEKSETLPPRRRSSTKPKNAATATPRPVGRPPSKPPPVASSLKNQVKKPLKKKSIFSPDNTSESETEQASSKVKTSAKSSSSKTEQPQKAAPVAAAPAPAPAPRPKGRPPKNALAIANNQKQTKPPPATPEKPKEEAQATSRQKRGSVSKPPPAVKKKVEKEKASNKYPSKAYVSSSCTSSANTESSGSGSSSDSDSSSSSRKSDVSRRSKSSTKSEMSRKSEAIKRSEQTPRKSEVKKNEPKRRSGGAEVDKKPEEEKKSVAQPATTRRSGRPGRSSNRTGSGSGSGSNISKVEVKTEKESTTIVTDSDAENTKPANSSISSGPSLSASKSAITRKLTRSALTRKSRHLVGRGAHSDTDSDAESGTATRSSSKSPVKRTSVPTKGPPAILCPMKARGFPPNIALRVPDKDQELMCPLPGCDSKGHLSGRLEKHFTIEACPRYHNTTPEECVERFQALKTTLEARKMAHHALQMRRNIQPSLEQRAYQLKVKDMRSKWKPVNSSSSVSASASVSASNNSNSNNSVSNVSASGSVANTSASSNNSNVSSREETKEKLKGDGELEPVLDGFVPDYDLALFREAQAAAAFKIEEELKNIPPSKGTRYVCMGRYCMEAWYQSPYPADAARLPQIYLCEFCLNHHKTAAGMSRHRAKCEWRHPPGDEVYRKGPLGVWQVDGRKHKQYCQRLCLLAKFFLDHKTLYYDVEPFLFYVMTLADTEGCHTVGYFSKEKNSVLNYNVSCILTLPPYQRQGYGRLLIDFSYLLTKVEGKIGSPEKPLSDLGLMSYRSYWKDVLLQYLCAHSGSAISIKDLSQEMAINSYDIVSTLQALGMMKYWKGKHIILKKQDVLDEYMERVKKRGQVKTIDPNCLKWKPYVPPTSQSGS